MTRHERPSPPAGPVIAAALAKYAPEVQAVARAARAKLRERLPGAVELVYDNFNALVIGFGPNERATDAWFSIALYPKYVNLFFLQGALLADPGRVLQGSGKQVRFIRLVPDAAVLDRAEVRALIAQALKTGDVPLTRRSRRKVVVRAVSARQRPRRPPGSSSDRPTRPPGR